MNTVIQLAWATLERVFPRVASAVVIVAFAAFTDPGAVGVYSWVALTYTLYQAVAESALRNQAVVSVSNPRHVRSVRRTAHSSALLGSFAILVVLVGLWFTNGQDLGGYILGLVPFLVVPFITTAGIVPVARLQYLQEWHKLARYQLLAAVAGLSLSFVVVWLTRSSVAMAVHLLATESTFLFLVHRAHARVDITPQEGGRHPRKGMRSLVTLSALGWGQGQLERVFVGGFAGVGNLGTYSTAVTMGRSPGEALSSATSNFLRARISAEKDTAKHPALIRRITLLAVLATTAAVGVVLALVEWVLDPILGDAWNVTLAAVPTLAVATIPYSISLALQIMAIYYERPRASIVPAVMALACAPLIGWVALESIEAAAYVVVGKELLVLLVTYALSRIKGAALPVMVAVSCTAIALPVVNVLM
ncbi:lipopolysaccharide biosynthesis protein [Dermatophilus congolensis]|uniref:lipopolysaccharide biosynthesis protein n=1 Tax=Dermatophilus congolensis TaxID=1863 RepID=UPI001AB008DB|nr:oligosaccharide flippase family protein [Dermatophilus congolensis]MBO3143279.1 oligosaccharide flippase family protein [Dermatophilus congolensis]MBO3152266.1 oligosaccharide flippase family protein [Dermatophilus congolensis]MBO3160722.1 oligosaccharide flippase family protein [Dermatophilus congolensis]MBO3163554.1 oligosaccharide flippase family protein [Dermatophilus congolensis]MBO3177100.1 oligosaccharide flippase family protein [Dermatophilus congolensis]